jgi:hypothetical protein
MMPKIPPAYFSQRPFFSSMPEILMYLDHQWSPFLWLGHIQIPEVKPFVPDAVIRHSFPGLLAFFNIHCVR